MSAPDEWFRDWFGDTYLSLYPHRDEDEAADGVELFLAHASPGRGERILDLACGAGRHLAHLRRAGLDATGMDLSATLLGEAAGRRGVPGHLVRGDMRDLPFRDGAFGGLVNFFTSFGYFLAPEEDARVVREIRRVLAAGRPFLIDYLNAPRVIARLEPESIADRDGRRVRQTRWVEGDHVFKRIEILDGDGDAPDVFHERVRLYRPDALVRLLDANGLRVRRRVGDYRGGAYGPDAPRLILLGEAA